ncbi:hypothetical protein [Streptomyces sp. NPDC047042]|uniref:hypothetical protein n=1 Tax=Streptomyces sp. NPDC047042 TaxID=3154807 RepID=UPI0034009DD6
MAVIDREIQTALDTTRDRYGRTVHHHAAATARARRNEAAMSEYAAHLAPHGGHLLDSARRALDTLPPARHITAWRELLGALDASHAEIVRALERPAEPGSAAEREQHSALWPQLAFWGEHGLPRCGSRRPAPPARRPTDRQGARDMDRKGSSCATAGRV